MSWAGAQPMGALLAGGLGRRIGGAKATVALGGRPLIDYPLSALRAVLADVAVVAKPDTELPPGLAGVSVLREPAQPRHPLVGIVHALEAASGRPVLVCPADLPFITPQAVRALLEARSGMGDGPAPALAVIATGPSSGPQPLLGCYGHQAAALLAPAAREGRASVRATVLELGPRLVTLGEDVLFNVNDASDLREAKARLRGISRT